MFPKPRNRDGEKSRRREGGSFKGVTGIREETLNKRRRPVGEEFGETLYVAVGDDDDSSMGALGWALKYEAKPFSSVKLIHVFPEIHRIPTPLGNFPKNQVIPAQVESHRREERKKRASMLQKYINLCSEFEVNADIILVENDLTAKAILELIPLFHARKLVLGVASAKSNPRKSKEESGIAEEVEQNAPEFCKVKIIRDGQEENLSIIPSPLTARDDSFSPWTISSYHTCFSTSLDDRFLFSDGCQ